MTRAIRLSVQLVTAPFARSLSTWKAETAPTTRPVVRKAASSMCASRVGRLGLKMTAMKSVARSVPSARVSNPCGVCIQLLADRIQKAEMVVPTATRTVARKWSRGPTFFQPNSMTPRKEASRKKAVRTS